MSNSIWKKPTVRPVKDCIVVWQNPARMSFTLPITARKHMEMYNCERWATLDDLIAQADKVERLQKAVDKALHYLDAEYYAYIVVHKKEPELIAKVMKEIKQLIKEKPNDK